MLHNNKNEQKLNTTAVLSVQSNQAGLILIIQRPGTKSANCPLSWWQRKFQIDIDNCSKSEKKQNCSNHYNTQLTHKLQLYKGVFGF